MKKALKAELWEIQFILYLILAQLIPVLLIKWVIWVWAAITFVGTIRLISDAYYENKRKIPPSQEGK